MPITRPPTRAGLQPAPVLTAVPSAPAQAVPSLYGGMNIPNQPLSPDIEDRRNGSSWLGAMGAKAQQLMGAVQDDYTDSFGNKNMTIADIPDVSRMQPAPKPIRRNQ